MHCPGCGFMSIILVVDYDDDYDDQQTTVQILLKKSALVFGGEHAEINFVLNCGRTDVRKLI